MVVSFGGDGTVNEAANGLVGSDTPLTCLPGGATNVFCRMLGIPNDVVDATEHLLRIADDFEPRRIDTGIVNGRHFVFASGIGLDASVVERVDAHPRLKARLGPWYFTYAAVATFNRKYLVKPVRVRVEVDDRTIDGVTVIVQNADPFTYFRNRPIRICHGRELDDGRLGLSVLKKATPGEIPTVIARVFSAQRRDCPAAPPDRGHRRRRRRARRLARRPPVPAPGGRRLHRRVRRGRVPRRAADAVRRQLSPASAVSTRRCRAQPRAASSSAA